MQKNYFTFGILKLEKLENGQKSKRRSSKINLENKRFYASAFSPSCKKALGSALSRRLYLLCK